MACVLAAPKDLTPVYVGSAWGLLLNACFVAWQVWGTFPLFDEPVAFSGLFANRNLGIEASVLTAIGLAGIGRWWWALGFLPTVTTGLVHRGGLAVLGLVAALTLARRNWLLGGLAIALSLAFAGYLLRDPYRLYMSFDMRFYHWKEILTHLSVWGWGLGAFVWAFPWFEHAHNDPLQVLYELGILGLCAYCSFFGLCFAVALWPGRMVILAFVLLGLVGFPLYAPATVFLIGMVTGSVLRNRFELFDRICVGKLGDYDWEIFRSGGGAPALSARGANIPDPKPL